MRSLVSVCALHQTAGSHSQWRQARAHGSGGNSMLSHAWLPCCTSRVAQWRFAATGNCDLVSYFKGTFCGEWTVLCIRARCLLTCTTLRFVTLRRRQHQFIVYTYNIHERGFLVGQQKWTCLFCEVVAFFSSSFFSSLFSLVMR